MTRFRAAFLPILLSASIILAMGLMGAPLQPAAAAVGISVPGDYPTIQAAIDAATDGDTIVVAAGTYGGTTNGEVFPIVVNKQVTLLGAQASVDPRPSQGGRSGAETIIDGGESSEAVIQIAASGVVVNGFTITGGTGDIVREYGFSAENKLQGLLFCHNILYDYVEPGDEGIQIAYSDNVIIEYNYGHDLFQDAFSICHSSNGVIRYNEAHDIASENAAIYCYLTTNTDVIGNLVYSVDHGDDAHGNGIQLGDYDDGVTCTGGVIKDNVIHDVAQDGICVERMTGVTVEGNTIYGADSHDGAVNLRTVRSSTFRSNTVYNNDAIGVLIKSSSSLAFSGNSVHHNADTNDIVYPGTAGIWIVEDSDASTISMHCNNIYGNGEYGLKNLDTLHTASASSNWWGAASGPTHPGNPGGTGDAVSGYVSYTPWRTVASGSPMTWNVNPGGSIQTAVDAACPGDIVAVAAGTYAGKVTINKSLTLRGANYGISAGAVPGTRGPESIIQGGMQIGGNGVVVDGFKIDGPASVGTRDGIYIVGGTSGHTISNNVFVGYGTSSADDGWAMVLGHSTANIVVRNNGISNWWSTYVNPTDPSANILFEGNHFYDNYVGIGSDGLNDVNIQYNKFTNNILEGFGTSAVGSDVCAHNNDFAGNGAGINNYDSAGTVDATNNWWGYSSGPSGAGDGDGDAVSSYVDFEPWLGSSVFDPTVASVNPNEGGRGESLTVTVTGTKFTHAIAVSFGEDVSTVGFSIVSDGEITARIKIDAEAALGPRDVSVTSGSGTGTLPSGFTVTEAPSSPPGWYEQQTTYSPTVASSLYGGQWLYQTFTPSTTHFFDLVSFYMYRKGSPAFTVTISLYNADAEHRPMGSALCSTTFAASSLTTVGAWYEYAFGAGHQVLAGTEYAIVLSCIGGNTSNLVCVGCDLTDSYPGGVRGYSTTGGSAWAVLAGQDLAFMEGQGVQCTNPPAVTEINPSRGGIGVEALEVAITGADMKDAYEISFGPGVTVNSFNVESWTRIIATVSIDAAAAPGPRDVSVTTPRGTGILEEGFTVLAAGVAGWYEQHTTYSPTVASSLYGGQWLYQTFTPSAPHYFDLVSFYLYKKGAPAFTVTISLYNVDAGHKPTGTALCSTSFAGSSLTTTGGWYVYAFGVGHEVAAGTEYAIVLSCVGGDTSNLVSVGCDTAGGYARGVRGYSSNGGGGWGVISNQDLAFKEGQGEECTNPPTVTAVTPDKGVVGSPAYEVIISGSDFKGATAIDFGAGIAVSSFSVDGWTQISAVISIDAGAVAGPRDVSVTTPNGTSILQGGFTVLAEAWTGWYEQHTSYSSTVSSSLYGGQWLYQTFTPSTGHYFDLVSFYLSKKGNPTFTVTISLFNVDGGQKPTGAALCSVSFAAASLTTAGTWYDFAFVEGCQVAAGSEYALVLSSAGGDTSNLVCVGVDMLGLYTRGLRGYSSNSGSTWGVITTQDLAFKEGQGEQCVNPPLVTGVAPDRGVANSPAYEVIISGADMKNAGTVSFGPGITVTSFTVDSWTQITAVIAIDASAVPGPRDVTVTTPRGTHTLYDGFTVLAQAWNGWFEQDTTYSTSTSSPLYAGQWLYQTFIPSTPHYFNRVSFYLTKNWWADFTVTISLHNVDAAHKPTGPALCSTTFAASSISWTGSWREFSFSPGYEVSAGVEYAIVLSADGGDSTNMVKVGCDTGGTYAGGVRGYSHDGGASWGVITTQDLAFKEGQW